MRKGNQTKNQTKEKSSQQEIYIHESSIAYLVFERITYFFIYPKSSSSFSEIWGIAFGSYEPLKVKLG